MPFEIVADARGTVDFTVTLKTASGGYLQIAADDVVRVKIGRGKDTTPDLDLSSAAASANKSSVTVDELGDGSATHAQVTVRLAQGDTASLWGSYGVLVGLVDNSETAPADAFKPVEKGTLHVVPSLAGGVGLT